MERMIAALAMDGSFATTNIGKLMVQDGTIQNVPTNAQKAYIQEVTIRCIIVAQALTCTLEEAYREIRKEV